MPSTLGVRSSISIFAICRKSSSFSFCNTSFACCKWFRTSLNCLYLRTIFSRSRYSLLSCENFFISFIVSGCARSWPTSSNRSFISSSFSIISYKQAAKLIKSRQQLSELNARRYDEMDTAILFLVVTCISDQVTGTLKHEKMDSYRACIFCRMRRFALGRAAEKIARGNG